MKSKLNYKNWFVIVMVLITVTLAGCGGGGGGGSSNNTDDGDGGDDGGGGGAILPTGDIVSADGDAISSVDNTDPVYLTLSDLSPATQYSIRITDPNGTSLNPDGGFIATTDEDGHFPTSAIIQDLGPASSGSSSLVFYSEGIIPRLVAPTGQYSLNVQDGSGNSIYDTTFTVVNDSKVYCAQSDGTGRASFTPSETVYAVVSKNDGTLADGTYSCYVVSDLNENLANQDTIAGTAHTVTVTGGTGTVSLGTFGSGQYDVVCDLDADGLYDSGSDLLARPGRFNPCFTIQSANSGNDIIGQICSDKHGNYRDIFDPNATNADIRDVYAWISPSEQSLVQHAIGVKKYVVNHQQSWSDGDTLTDVDAAVEVDPVQGFCTNESPWLVWPRTRLIAGCYDCIIDVNANGVYDKGTDFIDNIDNTGDNSIGGMCVSDDECESFITITSHSDGDTVSATAITLEGNFTADVASAKIIITAGASSNTVNLVGSATFSSIIPLYSGANFITVSVTKADGTICSKTITITSDAAGSGTELFRAQLTWDGDTDMDLHLVKPLGTYENGGGGTTDCNYSNCKVGLDGVEGTGDSGENHSIEWGNAGSSDDAYLDVDCIACGTGIENVWMNEINEDGAYKVYIDAYSGSETNVTTTVYIHGVNVGTVNCGSMSSGGGTDSCFVGTIQWTGGTSGNGSFTASGIVASDF